MAEKLTDETLLGRCFSRYDTKRFGYRAFIVSFLIAFTFFTVCRPYSSPLPVLNMRLSRDAGHRMQRITESNGSKRPQSNETSDREIRFPMNKENKTMQIMKSNTSSSCQQQLSDINVPEKNVTCRTEPRTAYCDITGDVRIYGKSGSVFIGFSDEFSASKSQNLSWSIKPYARREHETALRRVREWTVRLVKYENQALPRCTKNHTVPAIIFSLGGIVGNHFHDFSDYVIPLYLTSRKFNGEVRFLVTNKVSGWIEKFQELIKNLSNYDVINIDDEEDVHCFGNVLVGLERHSGLYTELTIDPSTSSYSMSDFRQFVRNAYSLRKPTAVKLKQGQRRKPRMLIVARKKTRVFRNIDEISEMASRVGFEVVAAEASMSLSNFSQVVNSCDVMMGIHGAGLTNMVFLPDNAVLIQALPIGGLEWYAKTDFGDPSKMMNLRYLEYKIKPEESTLMQRYPIDHEVLRYPKAIWKRGYVPWKSVYLVQQNVILDVYRFRSVLLEALELLNQ